MERRRERLLRLDVERPSFDSWAARARYQRGSWEGQVSVGRLREAPWGRLGIGADATVYHMPQDVRQFWGGSRSFHAFMRWRLRSAVAHKH